MFTHEILEFLTKTVKTKNPERKLTEKDKDKF